MQDRCFVVGGASRGLGRAIAAELVARGARVLLVSRSADALADVAAQLGPAATPCAADLAAPDGAQRIADAAQAAFGERLDGVVVNGGGPPIGFALYLDESAWQGAFDLLIAGPIRLLRLLTPRMGAGGSILFVTSSSVRQPIDGLDTSNVLRPGVAALAKTLARQLGPQGIRVNSIAPGRFDTDRVRELDALRAAAGEIAAEDVRAQAAVGIPLGRYGDPAEFARAAVCSCFPTTPRTCRASRSASTARRSSHNPRYRRPMAIAPQQSLDRRVVVLAAGGTIAMTGPSATPELDAQALVDSVPALLHHGGVEARSIVNKPSAHLTLADQLDICRQARDVARRGVGVVVTHGTDVLEETAMLCDVLHDAEAPIVFTGAIRPASAAGADGPANLVDAVSVAASEAAAGLGVLVVFGGEIHHARCTRKTDTTSLVAFSSPQTGPLGRVTEGHPTIWSKIPRNPPLDPPNLDKVVHVLPTFSGDDGSLAQAALETDPDGLVVGTLGAGHLALPVLEVYREASQRMPIVAYCRPERGVILNATYGYAGSERDLRDTAIIPAGFLSPQAARMKLLACLASGLTVDEVRWAFRQDDG